MNPNCAAADPQASAVIAELRQRDLFEIVERIARRFNVTAREVCGHGRSKPVAMARHAVWAELYALGHWSYPRIGQLFRRDHTTIVTAVRKYRALHGQEAA